MTGCCRTPTWSCSPPPPGPASARPPDRVQPARATGHRRADQRSDGGVDRLQRVAQSPDLASEAERDQLREETASFAPSSTTAAPDLQQQPPGFSAGGLLAFLGVQSKPPTV